MARALYSALLLLLTPIVLLLERWRGPVVPGRMAERLGRVRIRLQDSIWVHAVSMGEVQAAAPLIRALLARYPARTVIVSTTTATGARRVTELFAQAVRHVYLPLDVPLAVRRFLDAVDPALAIVLETELWPNLFAHCARRGVPVLLASARLSARSVRRYRRLRWVFPGLVADTLRVAQIAAQTAVDRERFLAVGARAEQVEVVGNLKFDVQVAPDTATQASALRAALGVDRPIWVAGSTHEGEESLLLESHAAVCSRHAGALLVLVPRHPQRFDAVAADLERRGIPFVRRSQARMPDAGHAVLLVDTMGELQTFYAAGDVAFVGGTLIPLGGHNLLEPSSLGAPVLCGPHTFNAPDVAALLADAGALRVVRDSPSLTAALTELLADPSRRMRMAECGRQVIAANRGACAALLEQAARLLGR